MCWMRSGKPDSGGSVAGGLAKHHPPFVDSNVASFAGARHPAAPRAKPLARNDRKRHLRIPHDSSSRRTPEDQAAASGCSWQTIIASSVLTDWKFSGVI